MRVGLLLPDQAFALDQIEVWNASDLSRDLDLEPVLAAMAQGDELVRDVCSKVMLTTPDDNLKVARHRAEAVRDALNNPEVVRELHGIAVAAEVATQRMHLGYMGRYPQWALRYGVDVLTALMGSIASLSTVAGRPNERFASPAWTRFFAMLRTELDADYQRQLGQRLDDLRLRHGVLFNASLGQASRPTLLDMRTPPGRRPGWLRRLMSGAPSVPGFTIHPRDESGARALEELRSRGLRRVAAATAQAASHVRDFFHALRVELSLFVGCLNLHDALKRLGQEVSIPEYVDETGVLSFDRLYDPTLVLRNGAPVVDNTLDADGRPLIVVTGANSGGKSTFLRSVGLAQLWAQAGLMVPAARMTCSSYGSLATHFRREEDRRLESGKLDEELSRMSRIVDNLKPSSVILFNEAFAATNEREGSEISMQILTALLDAGHRVMSVTHLYELARRLRNSQEGRGVFLRAERSADGARTFRLVQGAPEPTSFGLDLYKQVFPAS